MIDRKFPGEPLPPRVRGVTFGAYYASLTEGQVVRLAAAARWLGVQPLSFFKLMRVESAAGVQDA
jgi:hypothetical protein